MTNDEKRIVEWLRSDILPKIEIEFQEATTERNLEGIAACLTALEFLPELAAAIERCDHKKD